MIKIKRKKNKKITMRIWKSHPLLSLINSYLVDSPQPSNISYLWNFGSLLGFCLVIQIVTGVTLAINGLLYNLIIYWNNIITFLNMFLFAWLANKIYI